MGLLLIWFALQVLSRACFCVGDVAASGVNGAQARRGRPKLGWALRCAEGASLAEAIMQKLLVLLRRQLKKSRQGEASKVEETGSLGPNLT